MKKCKSRTREERTSRTIKILYWSTLISFIIPVVFLIWQIVITRPEDVYDESYRSRADYVLMLVQCMLGIVVLHVPGILTRRFNIAIPNMLYILYIIFLYCAIFLGEVRNFYYAIPHWDIILHAFSSVMTGLFGFMVVAVLNRSIRTPVQLSPFFLALFAFAFAAMVGTLWEIYEFVFDGILGMNMQKFLLEDGTALIGRDALADTMEDIIVDCIGALCATVFGYVSLKHQKGWVHSYVQSSGKAEKCTKTS